MDDAPTPAPNAAMALALLRCAALSCDPGRAEAQRRRADRVLGAFADQIPALSSFGATYGRWLLERERPRVVVSLAQARSQDGRAQSLREASLATYRFGHVLIRDRDGTHPPGKEGAPLAYVCGARSCAAPTAEVQKLKQLIATWERPTPPIRTRRISGLAPLRGRPLLSPRLPPALATRALVAPNIQTLSPYVRASRSRKSRRGYGPG